MKRLTGTEPEAERSHWVFLAAISLIMLLASMSTTSVATALVIIGHEMDMSSSMLPWVMNAYIVAAAVSLILGGDIGRRWGLHRAYLAGAWGFLGASVLLALTPNALVLLAGRALQGFFVALFLPNSMALCKAAFPPHRQLVAIGAVTGIVGLGFVLGPVIGGLLTAYASWRGIFWMNLPIGFVVLLFVHGLVPHPAPAGRGARPDLRGVLLLMVGVGSLVIGLTEVGSWGWALQPTLLLLGLGVAALTVLALIECRRAEPFVDVRMLARRRFLLCGLSYSLSLFTLAGLLYFFNLFVQNAALLHYNAAQSGLALTPFGLAIFVAANRASFVASRMSTRRLLTMALALCAVGLFALSRAQAHAGYLQLAWPLTLVGLGVGLLNGVGFGAAVVGMTPEESGRAGGLIFTLSYMAASLGPALGSALYAGAGNRLIRHALQSARLSAHAQYGLARLLIGHRDHLDYVLAKVDPPLRGLSVEVIGEAVAAGFDTVTLAMAALLGILAVVMALFFPSESARG